MFKTLDLKSLSIGILITMLVVTFMLLATTNSSPTQWEYKIMPLGGSSDEAILNGLGKDGWEVVGFAYSPTTRTESQYARYVLKRAKVYPNKFRWKFW